LRQAPALADYRGKEGPQYGVAAVYCGVRFFETGLLIIFEAGEEPKTPHFIFYTTTIQG